MDFWLIAHNRLKFIQETVTFYCYCFIYAHVCVASLSLIWYFLKSFFFFKVILSSAEHNWLRLNS